MKLNTKENFINVLVDCKGESLEDAEEVAKEYRNNLENWITDCGGDENSIKEYKAFCGIYD